MMKIRLQQLFHCKFISKADVGKNYLSKIKGQLSVVSNNNRLQESNRLYKLSFSYKTT